MITFDNIFVTVGTTTFDSLLKLVVDSKAVQQFKKWQVKKVLIQGGKNNVSNMNKSWIQDTVEFEMYDYKTSIKDDLHWADLVICHAGAGTTIEALSMGKVCVVVPNESLMDNHQGELARSYKQNNYAFTATVATFFEDLANVDPSKIVSFPPKQVKGFIGFVLSRFGHEDKLNLFESKFSQKT